MRRIDFAPGETSGGDASETVHPLATLVTGTTASAACGRNEEFWSDLGNTGESGTTADCFGCTVQQVPLISLPCMGQSEAMARQQVS